MPQGATLPCHKNSGICRPSHQAHHGAAQQSTHKENTHTYLQTQTSSSSEGLSLAFGAKGDISIPNKRINRSRARGLGAHRWVSGHYALQSWKE
ncbi:hypothetical protein QQF64_015947 [Cirrhinus molitorella]|uniref:Uncharacterized protein n=1 Tax=Cirrhinus molitorella TaxID=172907 RepID=A0ABR3LLF8_9TELE